MRKAKPGDPTGEAVPGHGPERGRPTGLVRRADLGGELSGEGRDFAKFFADITTGKAGRPDLLQDYAPVIERGRTQLGTVVFNQEYQRHLDPMSDQQENEERLPPPPRQKRPSPPLEQVQQKPAKPFRVRDLSEEDQQDLFDALM